MIEAILPLPPSTNHLYFNLKTGGRAKSAEYKLWLRNAKVALEAAYYQHGSPKWPDKAPMRLSLVVGCNYTRDISNCAKPVEDAICAFLPVPDDRYNDEVTLRRDKTIEGFVRARIEPL